MIAVDGALVAESAGLRMRIDGTGSVVICRISSDPARLFDTLRQSRDILAAARVAGPLLVRAGIRIDILSGNRRIGRLGNGVKQNALGRLLRLPAAHIGS